LEEEFLRKWIGLRRVLRGEDVGDSRHLPGFCSVELPNARPRMRTGQELCKKHIRKQDASSVLGLPGVARYGDFGQGRLRLTNHMEILRRIPLPLLCHDLLVAFDKSVAGRMPAAGRVVPDHGLVHDDRGMQAGFNLPFGSSWLLILAHRTISASPRRTAA